MKIQTEPWQGRINYSEGPIPTQGGGLTALSFLLPSPFLLSTSLLTLTLTRRYMCASLQRKTTFCGILWLVGMRVHYVSKMHLLSSLLTCDIWAT